MVKISPISLLANLFVLVVILAAILFSAAGSLNWLQGWLFALAFSGFLSFYGLWTLRHDPDQLKERSQVGQNTKAWDRVILTIYTLLLIGLLVLSSLDAGRFGWAPVPPPLQVLAWLGASFAGWLIWWTASVNTYLSRTVRIQDDRGHQVIDAGPYSWVRHPMYLGVIIFMVTIPLALGSLWGLIPGGLIVLLFIVRTALEDATLQRELPGYVEYSRRVRYRLLPGIW